MKNARWIALQELAELPPKATVLQTVHPGAKVVAALSCIITAASFPKYAITGLLALAAYPVVIALAGGVSVRLLLRQTLLALPLVVAMGLANPWLDQTLQGGFGQWTVTGGVLSFVSIILRGVITITAALLLVATTGMPAICTVLKSWRVPMVLVMQLQLLYRYLFVLQEEVGNMVLAVQLRRGTNQALPWREGGMLLGALLIRSFARAQRIYQAMLCRGFDGTLPAGSWPAWRSRDTLYLLGWLVFFLAVRYDAWLTGIGKWMVR